MELKDFIKENIQCEEVYFVNDIKNKGNYILLKNEKIFFVHLITEDSFEYNFYYEITENDGEYNLIGSNLEEERIKNKFELIQKLEDLSKESVLVETMEEVLKNYFRETVEIKSNKTDEIILKGDIIKYKLKKRNIEDNIFKFFTETEIKNEIRLKLNKK